MAEPLHQHHEEQKHHKASSCAYCHNDARFTCPICHSKVCGEHYNASITACTRCMARHRTLCYVCYEQASHVCKICGQRVCGQHFDPNSGICVMCRTAGRREVIHHGHRPL